MKKTTHQKMEYVTDTTGSHDDASAKKLNPITRRKHRYNEQTRSAMRGNTFVREITLI